MRIDSITPRHPAGGVQLSPWISSSSGILSRRDIAMVQAATGMKFDWPRSPGGAIPAAALILANVRERQMISGSPLRELTSADVKALGAQGILDAAFVEKAVAYLNQGGGQSGETNSTSTATAATDTRPAPTSGSEAPNGAYYL